MLKIDVVTIFPQLFDNILEYGVLKESRAQKLCEFTAYDLRDFTIDKHKKVDDRPFGGGPGMVMTAQPLDDAVSFIKQQNSKRNIINSKTILLSPQGLKLDQKMLHYFVSLENIILICGRYEGVDERAIDLLVDMEVSIGDYVLTGGEIPAMVIIDGVIRLIEGIVGKEQSLVNESFEQDLLDFPQYTRPEVYKGLSVPEVLLSGNHGRIDKWRKERSLENTKIKRPDLINKNNKTIKTID
jgi:tRNA (guanine37-N1)-methyltransferase